MYICIQTMFGLDLLDSMYCTCVTEFGWSRQEFPVLGENKFLITVQSFILSYLLFKICTALVSF